MISTFFLPAFAVLLLYLGGASVQATSYLQKHPISYFSPISNITFLTLPRADHSATITVDVEIPFSDNYSNLRRRWFALADPNELKFDLANILDLSGALFGSHESEPVGSLDSHGLWQYLTTNRTLLEYPRDTQIFRLVLQPNNELLANYQHAQYPLTSDIVPYRGKAYRQLVTLDKASNEFIMRYREVGWARVTVLKSERAITGAFRVNDPAGLGVQPAVYHISKREHFEAAANGAAEDALPVAEYERALLEKSIAKTDQFVLWRDIDIIDTKIRDRTKPKRTKRASFFGDRFGLNAAIKDCDPKDERSFCFDDRDYMAPPGSYHAIELERRAGGENDTAGDSGFSSGTDLLSTIGSSYGCPDRRKIALVGLAGDCSFLQSFNGNSSAAHEFLINMVNTASQAYETAFNITLGVSAITLVNDTTCPTTMPPVTSSKKGVYNWNYDCSVQPDSGISDRLGRFSRWRSSNHANDGLTTWTLMTSCTEAGVVGLSWMGMACQSGEINSDVSGTSVVARTSFGWRVYAHEIGHIFGAVHDCTSDACVQGLDRSQDCCPLAVGTCATNGDFLMNPTGDGSQDKFSPCTVGNVCAALGRNAVNSTCLTSNSGVQLLTTNECGNGIVEEGEECDCGGVESCASNRCCDPLTCKFRPQAQCDDSNEICCQNCRFSSTDTVCHKSTGPCDFDIMCSGNSSVCPSLRTRPDGESCTLPNNSDETGLQCISGHCTSRDMQCRTLLDNTTISLDGTVVKATRSCDDDSSCLLACVDPNLGQGRVCFITSQNFLDGTPCRGTGRCQKGECVGGNTSGSGRGGSGGGNSNGNDSGSGGASSDRNCTLIIVLSAAGGSIALILFSLICYYCYCRRRKSVVAPDKLVYTPQGRRQIIAPPPPPPPLPPAIVYQPNGSEPQARY
jgi:uncharacterized membrane protein YgcG